VVAVTAILPGPPPRAVSPVNDKVQQSVTTAHTPLALTRKGLTATNYWQHTTPPPVRSPLFLSSQRRLSSLLHPCFQFQAIVFNFRWWIYAQPLVFNFRWWNFDMNFLDNFSTIFLGHKFLEKFDLGNFALFLWYYCCLICWVFILYCCLEKYISSQLDLWGSFSFSGEL
jgi:hypothetical protein